MRESCSVKNLGLTTTNNINKTVISVLSNRFFFINFINERKRLIERHIYRDADKNRMSLCI